MANQEEKLDKLLELQSKIQTDVALTKQSLDIHITDYLQVKESHYKLRDEFRGIKAKIVLVSTLVVAGITSLFNYIWKSFGGHS